MSKQEALEKAQAAQKQVHLIEQELDAMERELDEVATSIDDEEKRNPAASAVYELLRREVALRRETVVLARGRNQHLREQVGLLLKMAGAAE